MYKDGAAWADLKVEYRDSLNMIKEVKSRRKNSDNHADAVDYEIAGSMESDLTQTAKELKKKVLYEHNAITEEDILNPKYGLTERQKEILLLRQHYNSYTEIANLINSDPRMVFKTYNAAINKLLHRKEQERNLKGVTGLSKQEEKVYSLVNEGCKPKEIACKLNVGINSVKYYLRMIKKKTGGKIG